MNVSEESELFGGITREPEIMDALEDSYDMLLDSLTDDDAAAAIQTKANALGCHIVLRDEVPDHRFKGYSSNCGTLEDLVELTAQLLQEGRDDRIVIESRGGGLASGPLM